MKVKLIATLRHGEFDKDMELPFVPSVGMELWLLVGQNPSLVTFVVKKAQWFEKAFRDGVQAVARLDGTELQIDFDDLVCTGWRYHF